MDAMKCFINQRDVSDRMKSYFPHPHSLSLSLFHSIFLPESDREGGREGSRDKGDREMREGVRERGREREKGRKKGREGTKRGRERKGEIQKFFLLLSVPAHFLHLSAFFLPSLISLSYLLSLFLSLSQNHLFLQLKYFFTAF